MVLFCCCLAINDIDDVQNFLIFLSNIDLELFVPTIYPGGKKGQGAQSIIISHISVKYVQKKQGRLLFYDQGITRTKSITKNAISKAERLLIEKNKLVYSHLVSSGEHTLQSSCENPANIKLFNRYVLYQTRERVYVFLIDTKNQPPKKRFSITFLFMRQIPKPAYVLLLSKYTLKGLESGIQTFMHDSPLTVIPYVLNRRVIPTTTYLDVMSNRVLPQRRQYLFGHEGKTVFVLRKVKQAEPEKFILMKFSGPVTKGVWCSTKSHFGSKKSDPENSERFNLTTTWKITIGSKIRDVLIQFSDCIFLQSLKTFQFKIIQQKLSNLPPSRDMNERMPNELKVTDKGSQSYVFNFSFGKRREGMKRKFASNSPPSTEEKVTEIASSLYEMICPHHINPNSKIMFDNVHIPSTMKGYNKKRKGDQKMFALGNQCFMSSRKKKVKNLMDVTKDQVDVRKDIIEYYGNPKSIWKDLPSARYGFTGKSLFKSLVYFSLTDGLASLTDWQ